ncbi:MAG: hypothetical protein ABSG84_10000 [Acidobacteriaceae bacterium]|jgi:hypothetical protein
MELASLRLAVCAAVLLPVTCIGQQCDTSAFTYNQSNGEYYMPGGTNSATNANQCSCLQQQWDTINQQIQTQHQNCLDANQNQPNVPNSGATPGSLCSRSSCQSLHDALYTTMAPREQQQMAACNASVAQYQAHLQAQQAAEQQQQAAEQAAQQQRTIELTSLKQQVAAMLKSSQDAAQARATAVQQLQTRISQELGAATPQNPTPSPTPGPTPTDQQAPPTSATASSGLPEPPAPNIADTLVLPAGTDPSAPQLQAASPTDPPANGMDSTVPTADEQAAQLLVVPQIQSYEALWDAAHAAADPVGVLMDQAKSYAEDQAKESLVSSIGSSLCSSPQNQGYCATATPTPAPNSAPISDIAPVPQPSSLSSAGGPLAADETAAFPAPAPTPAALGSLNIPDPATQSILADALHSSDPVVQDKLAQYQQASSQLQQNQATEAQLAGQAYDEECAQLVAACWGAVASLKTPADAVAAAIGTEAPGFNVAYNAATGVAGAVSQGIVSSEFPMSEAVKATGETANSSGEYLTGKSEQLATYAEENPDSILAPTASQAAGTLGKSFSVLGGTVGAGVSGYGAYQAYQQGNGFGLATSTTAFVGSATQVGGVILNYAPAATYGGGVATIANLVQSAPASYNAAADAIGDLHQAFSVIPQQYSNMISSFQQQDAQLAAKQQALLQEIQEELQSQSIQPPTTITVP